MVIVLSGGMRATKQQQGMSRAAHDLKQPLAGASERLPERPIWRAVTGCRTGAMQTRNISTPVLRDDRTVAVVNGNFGHGVCHTVLEVFDAREERENEVTDMLRYR